MNRDIIIGDTHGCAEEVRELLRLVGWRRGVSGLRLFFAGDLIDRGPDPVGCVRIAREEGAIVVKGNHDEKATRYLRHEERRRATGKSNPMRPPPESKKAQWEALAGEDALWLEALPTTVEVRPGWLLVHGGFEDVPMGKQRDDKVIRCRYIDPVTGSMVGFKEGSLEQPPNTVYWSERWRGPDNVVYGHAVHSLEAPRIDSYDGFACYGIDTGCCFGGRLTAMILTEGGPDFVQVNAHAKYADLPTGVLAS